MINKKLLAVLCAISSMAFFAGCTLGGGENSSSTDSSSITSSDTTSQAHTHVWETEWSKDETGHWHACTEESCDVVNDKVAHDITNDDDCTIKFDCLVCGWTVHEAGQHSYPTRTDCTADLTCTICGEVEEGLAAHDYTNAMYVETADGHKQVCKNPSCTMEQSGSHVYDQEVAEDKYIANEATCTSKATYYKSCVCGTFATTADTFEYSELVAHTYDQEVKNVDTLKTAGNCTMEAVYFKSCTCSAVDKGETAATFKGDKDATVHSGTTTKLVAKKEGKHDVVYDCCEAVSEANVNCTALENFKDCTKEETCACGNVTKAAQENHVAGEDDGDITTAILCSNADCEVEVVPAVDWSEINHDFSSADDKDIYAVSAMGAGIGAATVNGIVADADATGGYALHAVTAWSSDGSGVQIKFNNVDVSNYSKVTLKLKAAENSVGISVNGGDTVVYNTFTAYTEVNLKSYISGGLNSIEIYRSSVAGINIYVDSVTFVEKKVYNYDFSSATDDDMDVVSAVGAATVNGIVADADAVDGYALSTSITGAGEKGVSIDVSDIDASIYDKIVVRIKTGDYVNVKLNGEYNGDGTYMKCSTYTDVKMTLATTGSNIITITRNGTTQDIYVDSITPMEKKVYNYDFSSATDDDLGAVSALNGGTIGGIVEVEGATGGYALQGTTAYNASGSGITIDMGSINVVDYSSIIIRFNASAGIGIYVNSVSSDTCAHWSNAATGWQEVDLITLCNSKSITTMDAIVVGYQSAAGKVVYVDSITLVATE